MLKRTKPKGRWLLALGCLLLTAGLLGSCAHPSVRSATSRFNTAIPKAPVVPPPGFIFTQYQAPLDFHMSEEETGPTQVTAPRSGMSEAHYLYIPFTYGLASFAWGDDSIDSAQKDGNIESAQYADYELLSVLGIYTNTKIHVYGE